MQIQAYVMFDEDEVRAKVCGVGTCFFFFFVAG